MGLNRTDGGMVYGSLVLLVSKAYISGEGRKIDIRVWC
jgi:hypothetical protein